jgi:CelD/BcsL family acetyltransferase involved in cellulose biosynthesis
VERVSDPAAFRELRQEWDELLAASPSNSFFLTWEWLHTWWTHLAGRRRLFLLTVRSGDRLVAIAPFAVRTRWAGSIVPVRVLEFLGADRLSSDYLDVIIRHGWEQQAVDVLSHYLVGHPFLLELANVHKTGGLARALAEGLTRRGWDVTERKVDACPFIRVSGQTWESYLANETTKGGSDFRRRLRNTTRQFAVDLQRARTEAQRRDFLQILVEIHNRRWEGGGGSDAFNTPDLQAFHDEATRLALERDWLRLFILSLDGRPVAALYGLCYHGTFLYLQLGSDHDYARQSVGQMIIGLTIKSAVEEGVREYDFLRGAEPYKFRWTQQARELVTLRVCPGRVRDLLYQRVEAMIAGAKGTVRGMLPRRILDWVGAYRQLPLWSRFGAGRS